MIDLDLLLLAAINLLAVAIWAPADRGPKQVITIVKNIKLARQFSGEIKVTLAEVTLACTFYEK